MRFVRLQSKFPVSKIENNLKRADYYTDEGDKMFTAWSLSDYDKNQTGIHVSYDREKKKITAYHEDGVEHKNFLAPITQIFTGKISQKEGVTLIKGSIFMSPVFNIIIGLVYICIIALFLTLPEQRSNIFVIAMLFVLYFVYIKKAHRGNMEKLALFLDSITFSPAKPKKNNPNRKKGKWAGKHYSL